MTDPTTAIDRAGPIVPEAGPEINRQERPRSLRNPGGLFMMGASISEMTAMSERTRFSGRRRNAAAAGLGLLAVLLFFGSLRIRLLEVPLERDEGEYAYIAQLILHGDLPYLSAYSMKLPGIFLVYAGILAAFGASTAGIHLGLLAAVSLSTILVFVLARRLLGDGPAVAAAAAFALLSAGQSVQGISANAEPFVLPFALGGLLLLLRSLDARSAGWLLFLSGLCFGGAFIIKQHGAVFAVFGGLYLLGTLLRERTVPPRRKIGRLAAFGGGVLLPFAAVILAAVKMGFFQKFWFYAFVYSRTYVSHASTDEALLAIYGSMKHALEAAPTIWAAAGLGLFVVARRRGPDGRRAFWIGFTAASFLALVPGFYFRPHYFVLALPAVALLAGAAAGAARKAIKKTIPRRRTAAAAAAALALAVFGLPIFHERDLLFAAGPREASWTMYGPLPFSFNETKEIAYRLKPSLAAKDTVAVVGSEPQIYFYLGKKAPTGFLYVYYLTEEQPYAPAMQAEFIRDLETSLPDYLIYAPSWKDEYVSQEAYDGLFQWYQNFRDRHYEIIGLADVISRRTTVYRWGEEAWNYKVRSPQRVLVFRRR